MNSYLEPVAASKECTVDEILPLEVRVYTWAETLVHCLEQQYKHQYPNSSDPVTFSITTGKKYLKIVQNRGGVHAFIDKKTGQVYKPASWKSPAKHVRYDLRIISQREECLSRADWAGGYLYLR